MYSNPTYDPNNIVSLDFGARPVDAGDSSNADPGNPLLANAYQDRYMPGSTFKVLTTAIALDAGVIDLDTQFERGDVVDAAADEQPDPELRRHQLRRRPPRGVPAQLQHPVRPDRRSTSASTGMIAGTDRWGVGQPIPIDLPRPAASTFGDTDDLDQQLPLLAMRGFGQQEDQMVPLHMAMVAATVANGGVMMKPYVVAPRPTARAQR